MEKKSKKPRIVKCLATKEVGLKENFYLAPNHKYFKSEEIYKEWLLNRAKKRHVNPEALDPNKRKKDVRKATLELLCDYIGYKKGEPFPAVMIKKIKELEFYSDDIIYLTAKKCKNTILWAFVSKKFASTTEKVLYMMAIIRNAIGDVYKEELKKEKLLEADASQNEKIPEITELEIESLGVSKQKNDVSDFLGDELWT